MGPLWGIDLGGTKIEGVVLEDRQSCRVLKRMRVPTESHKEYVHILRQINKLIETMIAEVGVKPAQIGFGTPGTLDPMTQKIKNSNSTALNGQSLKRDLENMLKIPVTLANDANCFAVAEANLGIVPSVFAGAKVVFGVIMGTGVGGGLVVNGETIIGRQGIAGEWGHNFLDESGGLCYCGRIGCVETILSGPALERFYYKKTKVKKSLKEINALHKTGEDEAATATIDRLIEYFGKAIGPIINVLDPDAIILGGGVSNIEYLYSDGVNEAAKYTFNHRLDTLFLKPKLGDSAGVFGAALL